MKLHLHFLPDSFLEGFDVSICLSSTSDLIAELDALVCDAEAIEIIVDDVIEYIPMSDLIEVLGKIVKKLRHDGEIIITGVDANAVAQDFASLKLSIEDFNILIHGKQSDRDTCKLSTLTQTGVVNFLTQTFGMKILEQRFEDHTFIVKAKRP